MLDYFMSNPNIQDSQAPIAGEPAGGNIYKNIPSISNKNSNRGTISETLNQNSDKKTKSKSKVFVFLQVMSLILALGLSTYSILLSESLELKSGQSGDNAVEVLIRTEGRNADQVCTEGGADIFIGNDANTNGILDESEVTSTTRICHGKEGLSGPQGATGPNGLIGDSTIIDTKEIAFGNSTCNYGGLLIKSGLDNNSNEILDNDEIITEQFLCDGQIGINGNNGTQGAPALVEKKDTPNHICSQGFILEFGIDDGYLGGTAFDNILQDSEVRETLKVCSQPLNNGPITDFAVGITNGISTACNSMTWIESKEVLLSAGSNGANGCELWSSKATLDTTTLVSDINPTGDSIPGLWLGMKVLDSNQQGIVFFDADDGNNGRELWISDATISGTQRITSVNGAGDGLSSHSEMVIWKDGIVFTDVQNRFMWSNGSTTTELFDAPFISSSMQTILDNTASDISAHSLTNLWPSNTGLYFSAGTPSEDFEMHHLSNVGILTSWNLNLLEGSMPDALLSESGHNIVIADDGNNGRQLARLNLDGTHTWLTALTLQSNGAAAMNVGEKMGLSKLGDLIVFDAQTSGVDTTLWSYNLSSGLTQELSSIILAPGEQSGVVISEGKVWFDCVTPTTANELCFSDGTIAGSKLAYEFQPGISSSDIRHIKLQNQHLLVIADGEYNGEDIGHCLWSIDLNSLHATPVYDPWSGIGNNSQSGTYGQLINNDDIVFFIANNGNTGHEIHTWSPQSIGDEWLIW